MPGFPGSSRLKIACSRAMPAVMLTAAMVIALASGCEQISKRFTREALPNYGPPLPISARMVIDPSVAKASAPYVDSCGHPDEMRIGSTLQDALLEAAYQTFKTVQEDSGSGGQPDIEIRIRLLKPMLSITGDAMYDRAPTELRLDGMAEFRDPAGKLLAERELHIVRKDRIIVEPSQKRCAYITDPFVQDAAVMLTTQFMREARTLLDPAGQYTSAPAANGSAPKAAAATPAPGPTAPRSPLTFKATLLDENGNGVIEGGERVRVRVEVANAGSSEALDATVRIAGTPGLVAQFPSPSLPVGLLQPGESRSIEFVATVPQSVQPHRAELTVTLADASSATQPPGQLLSIQVKQVKESSPVEGGSGQRLKRDRPPR
jgi:hypothetical protein